MASAPVAIESHTFPAIEVFPNRYPARDYTVEIHCPEYTAVCPMTALPDFGTIIVSYIPDKSCIELKAFKYYLFAYRHVGIFYENAVNRILDDIVAACDPQWIEVKGIFSARGGIHTNVVATHDKRKSG